jgi:hypothetical protein
MTGDGHGTRHQMDHMPISDMNLKFPVDAHVHFHRLDRVVPTLDAAARHFGKHTSPGTALTGALLLAQASHERVFEDLVDRQRLAQWDFSPAQHEPQTLLAGSADVRIAIVCGRQIRCDTGIEVLALGTLNRYPDGRSLADTIDRLLGDDVLTVLPWGFLKWLGPRSRQIRELLGNGDSGALCVGDNGGRMGVLGLPPSLRAARASGYRILPGTDPFPVGRDYRRTGAYGFHAPLQPDACAPWTELRHWLDAQADSPRSYGKPVGPLRFLVNQAWIQVHNRRLGGSAR